MDVKRVILFILYFGVGAYLLTLNLAILNVGDVISKFDKWAMIAGGLLCVFGGINHLRVSNFRTYKNSRNSY
jgi:hypothetical protein